jgi:hypothetical protein
MSIRASKEAVYKGLDEPSLEAALKGQNRYPASRRSIGGGLRGGAAGVLPEARASLERALMERFRELLRFDGRLSRLGFWRGYLWLAIVGVAAWAIGLSQSWVLGPWEAFRSSFSCRWYRLARHCRPAAARPE